MSLFWLLAALSGIDECKPVVEQPVVEVDQRNMEIFISRTYGVPWSVCAGEKGGTPPLLRVTAKDGAGTHVLLEKPIELRDTLRAGTDSFSAQVSGCSGGAPSRRDEAPNRRDPGAVLQGPVGSRHWYNPRTIEVELIAEGPFLPIAFKAQTEVFCRACSDGDTVSTSYYINDFRKNTARLRIAVDKARYECARGGGRMILRRFWTVPDVEEWAPIRPYEVVDNLQDRLKPEDGEMTFEVTEPAARFCRPGKSNLFEIVGVDEYASIIRRNYGPSDAMYRNGIEFLRCK